VAKTSISWTDWSWGVVRGCTRVSEGCRFCWAERMAARNLPGMRSPKDGQPYARTVNGAPHWVKPAELIESKLSEPLHWRTPRRVFVASSADIFHEALSDHARDLIFTAMNAANQHTYQILTKRPKEMLRYVTAPERRTGWLSVCARWPLPNVWLGVSCEDQATADVRIPLLLQTPAALRFVSLEPLLGLIDLLYSAFDGAESFNAMGGLSWAIVGGESGPKARPCNVEWVRSLRDQCRTAGCAVFLKQMGSFWAREQRILNGSALSASGADPREWPEDLHVQEFPDAV
jgi:protein gp37